MKNICLVMTGCIAPPENVYTLYVTDHEIRKEQYKDAILFYIKYTKIRKIIFCDNSEADEIDGLKQCAENYHKEFEWLSCKGNIERICEKGKGYGEGEILKYILDNSYIIRNCDTIVKVTGRIQVRNLNSILVHTHIHNNYFNIYIDEKGNKFADTRFFIIKIKDFKDVLLNEYKNVDDKNKVTLEVCYANKIIKENMQYQNFPICIDYEGVSGSSGIIYHLSKKEKYLYNIILFTYRVLGITPNYLSGNKLEIGYELPERVWAEQFSNLSGKNIAIYGAGIIGQRFYKLSIKYCNVSLWVDSEYSKLNRIMGKKIKSPQKLNTKKIDCVVISVRAEKAYEEICENIKCININTKIMWFNGDISKNDRRECKN